MLKFHCILIVLFLLVQPPALLCQQVLRRVQDLVLIDIDESAGLSVDDYVHVFRQDAFGVAVEIGAVQVARFQGGHCAARVVNEKTGFKISEGDFIRLPERLAPDSDTEIPAGLDQLFAPRSVFYTVSAVIEDHLLIDAGTGSELLPGGVYPVRRETSRGTEDIGSVEILRFRDGQCAGKLVASERGRRVAVNDLVFAEALSSARRDPVSVRVAGKRRGNTLGYGSIGAGVLSAGLGYFFYSGALGAFDEYKAAQSASDALQLYDKSIQRRNNSKIAFGVGGGLAAFGIVYTLLRGSGPPGQQNRYSIKPFSRPDAAGLGLQIVLN